MIFSKYAVFLNFFAEIFLLSLIMQPEVVTDVSSVAI